MAKTDYRSAEAAEYRKLYKSAAWATRTLAKFNALIDEMEVAIRAETRETSDGLNLG